MTIKKTRQIKRGRGTKYVQFLPCIIHSFEAHSQQYICLNLGTTLYNVQHQIYLGRTLLGFWHENKLGFYYIYLLVCLLCIVIRQEVCNWTLTWLHSTPVWLDIGVLSLRLASKVGHPSSNLKLEPFVVLLSIDIVVSVNIFVLILFLMRQLKVMLGSSHIRHTALLFWQNIIAKMTC